MLSFLRKIERNKSIQIMKTQFKKSETITKIRQYYFVTPICEFRESIDNISLVRKGGRSSGCLNLVHISSQSEVLAF